MIMGRMAFSRTFPASNGVSRALLATAPNKSVAMSRELELMKGIEKIGGPKSMAEASLPGPAGEHTNEMTVGIEERIKVAYKHICSNYVGNRDQIILIGFSRGAFIARCVADLICRIGLLTKRGFPYLNLVYQTWSTCNGKTYSLNEPDSRGEDRIHLDDNLGLRKASVEKEPDVKDPKAFDSLLKNKNLLRRQIQVKVCAVWDTVAALGTLERLHLRKPRPPAVLGFVDSALLDGIENAFHALSLYENRLDFLPIVWRKCDDELKQKSDRLQQCWFVGFHSDIGGSQSPESLAHISLAWMMARLKDFVDFDTDNFCHPPPKGSNWELRLDKDGKSYPFPSHSFKSRQGQTRSECTETISLSRSGSILDSSVEYSAIHCSRMPLNRYILFCPLFLETILEEQGLLFPRVCS